MKLKQTLAAAGLFSLIFVSSAFGGSWRAGDGENAGKWYYQESDGSFLSGGWHWLDGNQDGTAECYYFDSEGWMLAGTQTPDGYTVDSEGRWTVDGTVQTQAVQTAQTADVSFQDGAYGYYQSQLLVREENGEFRLASETPVRFESFKDFNYDVAMGDLPLVNQAADFETQFEIKKDSTGFTIDYDEMGDITYHFSKTGNVYQRDSWLDGDGVWHESRDSSFGSIYFTDETTMVWENGPYVVDFKNPQCPCSDEIYGKETMLRTIYKIY